MYMTMIKMTMPNKIKPTPNPNEYISIILGSITK